MVTRSRVCEQALWVVAALAFGDAGVHALSAFENGFSRDLVRREATQMSVEGQATSGGQNDFTIVVNAFRRDQCLKKALANWLECKPTQIRVAWNDAGREIPAELDNMAKTSQGVLVFDIMPTKDLTNRFKPQNFVTDAVFSVDDDIVYPCNELSAAYSLWQTHQNQAVGFGSRMLTGIGEKGYRWNSVYLPGSRSANALFVTKGGFLHRKFYNEYFSSKYENFRTAVNEHTTGEDILMAFVVALSDQGGFKPVPLLAEEHTNLFMCNAAQHQLDINGDQQKFRGEFVRSLFKEFGANALKAADINDFFYYDTASGNFKDFAGTCGLGSEGDSAWLDCINRVKSTLHHPAILSELKESQSTSTGY